MTSCCVVAKCFLFFGRLRLLLLFSFVSFVFCGLHFLIKTIPGEQSLRFSFQPFTLMMWLPYKKVISNCHLIHSYDCEASGQ